MDSGIIEQFIRERQYLKNVTPKTLIWYRTTFKHFADVLAEPFDLSRINGKIADLMQQGIKPRSIASYLTCVRAYLKWRGSDIKIQKLRLPKNIPVFFREDEIEKLMKGSRAGRSLSFQRSYALAMLIVDTGMRADEALSLRRQDIHQAQRLLTVTGKGRKQRVVPYSEAGAKALARWLKWVPASVQYVFGTASDRPQSQSNALRDHMRMLRQVGIKREEHAHCGFHILRHTFATNYLRAGGDLARLKRILGHSNIETTLIYEHLQTQDLQDVHEMYSPLGGKSTSKAKKAIAIKKKLSRK